MNPLEIHLGLNIMAVIEEDDAINLLAAGLIHRSRELLFEAGVADDQLAPALKDIISQVMTGDLVGTHIETDSRPLWVDGQLVNHSTATVTMNKEN